MPWLQTRPGPELPAGERSYILYSWKKTWKTVCRAAKLRYTFFFLMAWFLYADGYSTIAAVAVLFGKAALNMTRYDIIMMVLDII
jgi:UMF1 family MFS transporter